MSRSIIPRNMCDILSKEKSISCHDYAFAGLSTELHYQFTLLLILVSCLLTSPHVALVQKEGINFNLT